MARIWTCGFELGSSSANVEITSVTNAATSTAVKRSGGYSLKFNPAGTIHKAFQQFAGTAAGAPAVTYYRFYLYVSTLPSAQTKIMFLSNNSDSTFGLRLNTDGSLALYEEYSGAVAQIGSNSSALSTATWYRIEMAVDHTTIASSTCTAYIDGTSFATGTKNLTTPGKAIYLNFGDTVAQTYLAYIDDVAINDNSGSYQNSLPGDGKVIRLKPNAAGDVNTFATQTGGTAGASNNYTRVYETPPDTSTYNGSSTLNEEDLFNCDDSGIGASDTVNVVEVHGRFRNSTADATAGIKFEIEKTASGTKTLSTEIIPNSTTWNTDTKAVPRLAPIMTYVDPDGSAWTQTTLDSMQVGYKLTTAPTNAGYRIDVTIVYALVDYTPVTVTANNNNLLLLGVG